MFEIVDAAEYRKYRVKCSRILTKACSILYEKGITAQFTLVGSGARNMVTRNGNGPFDLDYNLIIIKALREYCDNLRLLKDTIRTALNKATKPSRFTYWQDSTSCLTAMLHFQDDSTVEFSFDVAIITKNRNQTICRLIHNKNALGNGHDQYVWNEIPDSHDVAQKAQLLKEAGLWLEVRKQYVNLKNKYLSRQDNDHPSFIVYIEAVNAVYNRHPWPRNSVSKACIIHL